jgi:hypothetical protein
MAKRRRTGGVPEYPRDTPNHLRGRVRTYRPPTPILSARPTPNLEIEIRRDRRADGVILSILDNELERGDEWPHPDEKSARADAYRRTGIGDITWTRHDNPT